MPENGRNCATLSYTLGQMPRVGAVAPIVAQLRHYLLPLTPHS
ncbi:uncharacterized protein G2W53_000800 [Senna tora]|uniref:Uncharacterized protein n=1 Tax=Senna tora TaxID=362788 RepID=A0A834XED6_9FABA|nr:uncharacterized protein G2W53_000800 [Senna tora]